MLTKEKIEYRISVLQEQHKNLDKTIDSLYVANTDDLEVQALKKKKLSIVDEIVRLVNELRRIENEV
jgi:hypothetical protein